MVKKGMVVEVTKKETEETLEKYFISSAKILKRDDRKVSNHMRANGKQIAKEMFCKEYKEDINKAGEYYEFNSIEENF